VEAYAYGCRVEPGHVALAGRLPVIIS